ncbi:MAG: hypothetical protein PHD10_01205 [Bacilli bacterium]|nr:hypothetical protein [Bacilli bacterium]MDD4607739.1 hypothetical protein [Bacilli bacterium]
MKKKLALLFFLLFLTGCSNEKLICIASDIDEFGNKNEIKYTFNYKKDELKTVKKNLHIKVKDEKETGLIFSMYNQTLGVYKDESTKIDGYYKKNTINIEIDIEVDKIEKSNALTNIAINKYNFDQMNTYMKSNNYECK